MFFYYFLTDVGIFLVILILGTFNCSSTLMFIFAWQNFTKNQLVSYKIWFIMVIK